MTFTPEQITHWKRYEKVRRSGRWNMFDPRARQATGLSDEEYSFVLENFSELKEAAEKPEAKAS